MKMPQHVARFLFLSAASVTLQCLIMGGVMVAHVTAQKNTAPKQQEGGLAPDDTGRNARDRDGSTVTPMDQSGEPRDVNLTKDIRKALMADDSLSMLAKNVKIITINGKVTLRGPVKTAEEKSRIVKKAKGLAKGPVDDQLEVTTR